MTVSKIGAQQACMEAMNCQTHMLRRWDVHTHMPGVLNDCLNWLRGPPAGSAAPAAIISRLYFEAAATRGKMTVPTNAAGKGGGTFLKFNCSWKPYFLLILFGGKKS